MKKDYKKPNFSVLDILVEDMICVSGFEVTDEHNIFRDVDVTIN